MGRGGRAEQHRSSPGRPLGLAVVAVVASFVASLALSHYSARSIDSEVSDIVVDAAPSIRYLARARGELRRLAYFPSVYLVWQAQQREAARAGIADVRTRLADALAAYDALPRDPGEAAPHPNLERQVAPLLALSDRILDGIDRGETVGARDLWQRQLLPAVESIDGVLAHLVESNAEQTRGRAQQIARVRRRAATTAMALGGLSVILAIAVAALAFETLRRQQRLAAERNLLVEARAVELEQFAGRVAHDIKSPLGAVGLALNLAQRGTTDPQRLQSVVTRALSSVQRVQQIVDELLALAKSAARPQPGAATSLPVVVDEVIDELRPLAEERRVAVTVQRAGDPGPWVACAPGALSSLVSNLLRNAVKYMAESRERQVQVRVLDRGRCARLEVDDTGPGIPEELQQQIFQAYVRAPGAAEPGIGLGLAIVKRLAEAHGGVVGVRSTVGKGSCFWFELPKVAPQPQVAMGMAAAD